MKIHSFWFLAMAAVLCGCQSNGPQTVYRQPLSSPGGVFATLPPAVQSSVRAEAGMAEIDSISKETAPGVYVVRFRNSDVYPPLYLSSDGSVLTSNLTVSVGASADTIAASTGNEASGLKLDDLPPNVVQTIRHQAPTGEVASISRITSQGEIYFNVTFKDGQHGKILIRDDGKLFK